MLVSFEFNNFKSFKDNVELSMVPGKVQKHPHHINDKHQLLTFEAIYGANASGKSNFVEAVYTFQNVIKGNFKGSDQYCRLNSIDKNSRHLLKLPYPFNKIFLFMK